VFNREVLDAVPATSFQDIKENLIPKMYREGQAIELFAVAEMSPRVFNATSYLAVNRWLIQRQVNGADATNTRDYDAHPSAWIHDDAIIVGPVVIGAGARIHAGATIVGPASIGAGTVVESGATISRSVTWNNCHVGSGAVVDQCLLADDSVVEADSHVTAAVRVSQPERRPWVSQWFAPRKAAPAQGLVRPALS
jgi:NDP-sugar pyrophosphorylase family protein